MSGKLRNSLSWATAAKSNPSMFLPLIDGWVSGTRVRGYDEYVGEAGEDRTVGSSAGALMA